MQQNRTMTGRGGFSRTGGMGGSGTSIAIVAVLILVSLSTLSWSRLHQQQSPTNEELAIVAAEAAAATATSNQNNNGKNKQQTELPACQPNQLIKIKELFSHTRLRTGLSCPDSTWLTRYGTSWVEDQQSQSQQRPLRSIYTGCNKGHEAVQTLQLLSRNNSIQFPAWRALWNDVDKPDGACSASAHKMHTLGGDNNNDQSTSTLTSTVRPTEIYCIEAMPATARQLTKFAQQLGWAGQFHVHNRAVSDKYVPGAVMAFPNSDAGVEHLGLKDCLPGGEMAHLCQNVTSTTVDAFVQAEIAAASSSSSSSPVVIDFLSIDVEGNDWLVLQGSAQTLKHTKYLEFEYHKVGAWESTKLSDALDFLYAAAPYRCYWAGWKGYLWRITGCFLPVYNVNKKWSNVACVNQELAPELAANMEKVFKLTGEIFEKEAAGKA